jgi:gas vesicle protein
MNTRATLVLTGAAAFAGGLIAGILLAPESGHRMRSKLIARMNVPVRWVDDRLDELEGKLHDLENHVEGVRKQVRTATIGRVVPDVPDREAFDVDSAEIARELPRMPKR